MDNTLTREIPSWAFLMISNDKRPPDNDKLKTIQNGVDWCARGGDIT